MNDSPCDRSGEPKFGLEFVSAYTVDALKLQVILYMSITYTQKTDLGQGANRPHFRNLYARGKQERQRRACRLTVC